ncbi:hypothetical protein [Algicella marina]|uniref:Uncharacterized protein n=1 Tax=Algicella marina TaxID=2683284 RepID=A0A6P1SX57_9RHOB|nr:hypothetical protein [Algicella marina]QHQ34115.1 hypothetical protein GO499_02400 [Algicella marina]
MHLRCRLPPGATRQNRRLNRWTDDGTETHLEDQYLTFSEDGLIARAERRNDAGEVVWFREAERVWSDN